MNAEIKGSLISTRRGINMPINRIIAYDRTTFAPTAAGAIHQDAPQRRVQRIQESGGEENRRHRRWRDLTNIRVAIRDVPHDPAEKRLSIDVTGGVARASGVRVSVLYRGIPGEGGPANRPNFGHRDRSIAWLPFANNPGIPLGIGCGRVPRSSQGAIVMTSGQSWQFDRRSVLPTVELCLALFD